MSSVSALMKPVRVIRELTVHEQFIRALERAGKIRDDARARADAEYIERVEDARNQYLVPKVEASESTEAEAG